MAQTAETFPQSAESNNTIGTLVWSDTGKVFTRDNDPAFTTQSGTQISQYLRAYNFGFELPEGAGVDGVLLNMYKRRTGGAIGLIRDHTVALWLPNSTISDNKALTGTNWLTGFALSQYGGASDSWGGTLRWSDVNDTDFGVVVSITSPDTSNRIAQVDSISLVISYTEGVYEVGGADPNLRHETRLT